jgi:CRP/FNR family transcriptional regulator, cyclic AMP receptor protein
MSSTTKDPLVMRLASLPLFAGLEEQSLETLSRIAKARRYPKGSLILSKGDGANAIWFVISGRAKLSITSPEGREIVLQHLDAPAHFGEMSLADTGHSLADVVALTEVEVLILDGRDLEEVFRAEPKLALAIISTLAARLRQTVSRLEDMAFHDATHRVMRVVLNVATASLETRGLPVVQQMTHYDIATLAGTSRETASRVISSLARQGIVTTTGRRIHVDLEKLTRRVQAESL